MSRWMGMDGGVSEWMDGAGWRVSEWMGGAWMEG